MALVANKQSALSSNHHPEDEINKVNSGKKFKHRDNTPLAQQTQAYVWIYSQLMWSRDLSTLVSISKLHTSRRRVPLT